MKTEKHKTSAALVALQWIVAVLCLLIGSAGVVCLFTESVATVVAILLIVTGLVSLPGLLVTAFGRFARGLGHFSGLVWRTIGALCRTSRLQARPGSRVC